MHWTLIFEVLYFSLCQVFQSINLEPYDLSVDLLDVHAVCIDIYRNLTSVLTSYKP